MSSAADPLPIPDAPPPTRPPFWFKRVRIRNYKSIAFCDVSLEPLTLFVGRNGAGKSNFLDALSFLRDFVAYGLSEAVSRHGGRDGLTHCKDSNGRLEIEVETADSTGATEAVYNLVVENLLPRRRPLVGRERVTIARPSGDGVIRTLPVRAAAGNAARSGTAGLSGLWAIDAAGMEEFLLADSISSAAFFNFSPEAIRRPQRPSVGEAIRRDGGNLAAVVHSIQEDGGGLTSPDSLDDLRRVGQYLTAVVPQVRAYSARAIGEYVTLQFDIDAGDMPASFDAASMSDGTLRVLATLVAAFQPDPFDDVPMVGFEEPELSLHPAAARALMAGLDEATIQRQILLTTHSPDLLDAEEVTPDRVRVVEYVDGATVIGMVDDGNAEIVRRHLGTLGELERDNRLVIDVLDLKRQRELAAGGGPNDTADRPDR